MNIAELFWHPTLLLFIGIVTLPVVLHVMGRPLSENDRGYAVIFWGANLVAFAAFVDYAEELAWGKSALNALIGVDRVEGRILPFLYFPGILCLSAGVALWLTRLQRAAYDARRREQVEEDLACLLDEMRVLSVRAEDASVAKSSFMAAMGHELRTPLNSVIGFAELMLQNNNLEREKRAEYLTIIADNGKQLLRRINDILEFTNLEKNSAVYSPEAIDLKSLIEGCVAFKRARHGNKTARIEVAGRDGQVWTDRKMVKQIMLNILSNAIRFTPYHGEISISHKATSRGFSIVISDTGVGMTSNELADAMRPFVQVHQGLARLHEGAGLGLPLADRFCRHLGGKLTIHSSKGNGTTVSIDLPHLIGEGRKKDQPLSNVI